MTHPGIVPVDFRKFLADNPSTKDGSEFGGVAGQIAPPPHDMTPGEKLHAIYAADPTDPSVEVDTDEAAPGYLREDNR